jgi:antitoxin (DNA-binding transcriptional repressor) of toxin-antitoxin stability system
MAQVHMTEAEVSSDFAAVLRRIDDGQDVVVDRNGQTVAIIHAPQTEPRKLSTLIELAIQREKARGYQVALDDDYASDVEHIVQERKPWTPRSWD